MPRTTSTTPVADEFETFMSAAYSDEDIALMSDEQRTDCRRVFFAGALAMFVLINENIEPDGEVTSAEETFSLTLEAELAAFGTAVEEGRA